MTIGIMEEQIENRNWNTWGNWNTGKRRQENWKANWKTAIGILENGPIGLCVNPVQSRPFFRKSLFFLPDFPSKIESSVNLLELLNPVAVPWFI